MKRVAEAKSPELFDPIRFSVSHPLATPPEIASGFAQLIDSICDLSDIVVKRVITPGLSACTVSWEMATVPSPGWLSDVEQQLAAFAVCMGVEVRFRRR